MKKLIVILLISLALLACNGNDKTNLPVTNVTEISEKSDSLLQEEIKGLDSVNINFQYRGNCYAYSSDKNAKPSNGEAHSVNVPKKIDQSFPRNGLYLVINQNDFSRIDSNFLGCKLYLVNTTNNLVTLNASDSRLDIVAEALNNKKEWMPISYLPSSWCGNSYHTVKLDKDEYWSFDIPVFKGKIKTKLRYVLLMKNNKKIISNEIVAHLNEEQFNREQRQGHNTYNIMDPYLD